MESTQNVSIEEITRKLTDKRMWLANSVEKLQTLPQGEKPYMWNHLDILRSHIAVLEDMERLAERGVRVSRERIYWEEPGMTEEESVSER